MIRSETVDGFCHEELINYINSIKKYAGKPYDERIACGFQRGIYELSGKRYIYYDLPTDAEPNELGICDDCKIATKKDFEKDLENIRDDFKKSVKDGFVNIEGMPHSSCSYLVEWWYMRGGDKIAPLRDAMCYPYNFNIDFYGNIQKKKILDMKLRIGVDFIFSDDTFTSSTELISKKQGDVKVEIHTIADYPEIATFSELFDGGHSNIMRTMNDNAFMKDAITKIDERVRSRNDDINAIMEKNKWIGDVLIKGFYDLAKCDNL